MKALEKLMFEVYKNFKLIFRNWSSTALIILAPLLLILLIGYSFSGEQLQGIKIGVAATDYTLVNEFAANVSNFATIIQYSNINQCILDMKYEKAHICLEIKGSIAPGQGTFTTGDIKFYYDNTRKKTSLLLMSQIKEFFGLTSEKISLISTEQIFSNIQDILNFLAGQISNIDEAKNEAEKIKASLIERRDKLVTVRDEFEPRYTYVKSLQEDFNKNAEAFQNDTESIIVSLENIKSTLIAIKSLNLVPENSTEYASLENSIDSINNDIEKISSASNSASREIEKLSDSVNEIVSELDMINQSLGEEITSTEEYIVTIDRSVQQMTLISEEASAKVENLSSVDPSLAEKISKPISQSFSALIAEIKDVQLAFPILLSTIIIFISIIFANVITSMELGNKAYVRNILAPVNDILYTTGIALTNFIIIFFQVAVLLVVTQTRFMVDVYSHLDVMIPVIIVIILLFVFIGMILAYLAKNIQTSILISTFIALAFFLFSDTINALESMPVLAAKIAAFNPVVIVNSIFRKAIFFDIPLSQMQNEFFLLLAYMGIVLVLLIIVSKVKNKLRLKDY